MHPAARIQAIIEILDEILMDWAKGGQAPADAALQKYTRARRFIGGGDRRQIGQGLYAVLRKQGLARAVLAETGQEVTGRNLVLAEQALSGERTMWEMFGETLYAPPALSAEERGWLGKVESKSMDLGLRRDDSEDENAARANVPGWMWPSLQEAFGEKVHEEMAAFQTEAPLVLRVNRLKATREAVLKELSQLDLEVAPTAWSVDGIRLNGRVPLATLHAFIQGRVEVQDESSQLACLSLGVKPGMRVIDFCAGAGGKALALAALMENQGEILAVDKDARRLAELTPRVARAGVSIITPHALERQNAPLPKAWIGTADAVLVDAPCSGLGTLRRNPDAAWRITQERLSALISVQASLLERAVQYLRPGGVLMYATCSILPEENWRQVNQLLIKNLSFTVDAPNQMWDNLANPDATSTSHHAQPGILLTPLRHATDGFYMARLRLTT